MNEVGEVKRWERGEMGEVAVSDQMGGGRLKGLGMEEESRKVGKIQKWRNDRKVVECERSERVSLFVRE